MNGVTELQKIVSHFYVCVTSLLNGMLQAASGGGSLLVSKKFGCVPCTDPFYVVATHLNGYQPVRNVLRYLHLQHCLCCCFLYVAFTSSFSLLRPYVLLLRLPSSSSTVVWLHAYPFCHSHSHSILNTIASLLPTFNCTPCFHLNRNLNFLPLFIASLHFA